MPKFLLFGGGLPLMWLAWAAPALMVIFIMAAVVGGGLGKPTVVTAGRWGIEVRCSQFGDRVTKRFPRNRLRSVDTSPGLAVTTDDGTYILLLGEPREEVTRIAEILREAVEIGTAEEAATLRDDRSAHNTPADGV